MELIQAHGQLVAILRKLVYPWRKLTIAIDGRDGAGKSNLARYLAWQLDMSLIETDLLLVHGTKPPAYRLDVLKHLIDQRHSLNRPVLIEGICLLSTLKSVGITHDYLVYVRNQEYGGSESLRATLESYEQAFTPKQKADYVFDWLLDR